MLFESIVYSLILSLCYADTDDTLLFCNTVPPKLTNGLIKRDRVSFYNGQGYLGNMEYMCLPGYDLIGNKIITCQNGLWTPMPQCIPKKRCSPIQSYPLNTEIESENITLFQNDPKQIIVGSTVILRCMDNYELDPTSHGSLIVQCQNDGSWTPMPTCRYAQAMCDYSKLYLPTRSRITRMNFKFSETNRQFHMVGSNLEYSCEDGYRLDNGETSLTVECLSSGSWSTLPVCEFVYETERNVRCTYPIYIKNGFIALYNVTIWEDQTYTGRLVYECNYGYETTGGKDQIETECINGTWTYVADCQEIPTCSKQDLLDIEGQVENSYVHNVSLQYIRDPSAFVYNSYVLRVCLPNFEHDPSSPPLKIQCERYTNTWTGIPICQALKTTPSMISTESEEIRMESDNLLLLSTVNQHQFQTTISKISTENEDIRRESDNLLLLSSSSQHQFQTTTPMTSTESDDLLSPIGSSQYQFQATTSKISIETEEVETDADNLLSPISSSQFQFETTTAITTTVTEEVKREVDDLTSPISSSQYQFQTTAAITTTQTEEVQREVDDLQSSISSSQYQFPTTTAITTTQTEEVQREVDDLQSSISSSQYQFPTTTEITTTESDDLLLPISSSQSQFETTKTTTMEMESSTLAFDTTHTIVCYGKEIPTVPHAIISQSEIHITYNVGTTLTFTCQLGYESLYNQTGFALCSINGTWTIDGINLTMCQSKSETTEEILFDTSTISSSIMDETNTAEYLEETLPVLNLSNETFTAFTRSIAAGNRQIRQITSYCKQFPQIEHAQLLVDDTAKHNFSNEIGYTGSVLFVCPYGFISDNSVNEPFRLTCQNGDFHPKVTCIEQPRCSLPPPLDSSRSSVMNSLINVFDTSTDEAIPGSFVTLNCVDKTNDEKSVFNMTCLENGQWLMPPPPCIAPFKRRCQSGITIPNARTQIHAKLTVDGYFDDGSRASYRCLENFVHDRQSGPLHIQCRNGRWGPRPRCVPTGCLEPLPDTIENGWKSAENYIIQSDIKYYLLTRYSCHANALMVDSSTRVIDIECRNGQWQYKALPVCKFQE